MIQIYSPGNTDFEKNGDMPLTPTTATTHVVLNGSWTVELSHPIDSQGRWKYIQEDAVIKMPSFNGEQLFRVKKVKRADGGVTASAEPIFYDAMDDCFLTDVRPTDKNGQQALDIMCAANEKYSGSSDIQATSTAYYEYKNLIEAINGDEENSFINRWGGEILFNNFQVIINDRVGGDYGVYLKYGKNIPADGLTEEVDVSAVITRIYPKAYNGHTMTEHGYVDSPVINHYPTIRAATMSFEDVKMREDAQQDDEENGIIICDSQEELDTALTEKCNAQFDGGVDKPTVTISANIVLLQNTEEYKEYAILEDVSLGDTIHCKHDKLDITTEARVIELNYDSIRKKVTSVVLGDFQYDYFDDVTSAANRALEAIRSDGSVMAEQVKGIIDGVKSQMRAQSSIAKKQDVRAIIFEDFDEESPTYGAMCLGTMGFQIASKRTADGKDWDWSTFGTGQGFFADFIVAGTMLADRIKGGTLELGGKDNGSGVARVLDASGQEIVRLDKDGVYAKGKYICESLNYQATVTIHDGKIIFESTTGYKTYIEGTNGGSSSGIEIYGENQNGAQSQKLTIQPKLLHFQWGTIYIVAENRLYEYANELYVSGKSNGIMETKSGIAYFSDGTYMEFVNGRLVGGITKEGSI